MDQLVWDESNPSQLGMFKRTVRHWMDECNLSLCWLGANQLLSTIRNELIWDVQEQRPWISYGNTAMDSLDTVAIYIYNHMYIYIQCIYDFIWYSCFLLYKLQPNLSIRLFPMKCSWIIPTLDNLDGLQSGQVAERWTRRTVLWFMSKHGQKFAAYDSPSNRRVYHAIFPAKHIFCIYFNMTKKTFKTLDFVNATPARLNRYA